MKSKGRKVKIEAKSPLNQAADRTEDIKGAFQKGLKALKGEYRTKIVCTDTKKLTGSVDIDLATKDLYPTESRWDYAIEYKGKTFFVEIHPADTTEVQSVINKLRWLINWLKNKAPEVNALKHGDKPFHWVFTKDCHILKTSKQWKLLSQKGLIPVKQLDLDKV